MIPSYGLDSPFSLHQYPAAVRLCLVLQPLSSQYVFFLFISAFPDQNNK